MTTDETVAVFRKTMTDAEQAFFTGISGNLSPLYVDEVYAQKATSGPRFIFELAVSALATTALAEIGGPERRIGTLSLQYPQPARVGDTIEAKIMRLGEDDVGSMECTVVCLRQDGSVVAEGRAVLVKLTSVGGGLHAAHPVS